MTTSLPMVAYGPTTLFSKMKQLSPAVRSGQVAALELAYEMSAYPLALASWYLAARSLLTWLKAMGTAIRYSAGG